jgi:hypothetical protein
VSVGSSILMTGSMVSDVVAESVAATTGVAVAATMVEKSNGATLFLFCRVYVGGVLRTAAAERGVRDTILMFALFLDVPYPSDAADVCARLLLAALGAGGRRFRACAGAYGGCTSATPSRMYA